MLTGQNGILTQANNAKVEQSHGAVREGIALAYNEYQIEINTASNTKLASTKTVQIQGKEEKALASYSSFLDFLSSKGYIKEGTTDVLNVEALTGSNQALGNGTDSSDVYKIEEQDSNYVVNYYDKDGTPKEIWSISDSTSTDTGDVTLDPDTGKEALILVYNVSAGDTIELPYYLIWYDGKNENPATFDFTVDWGDGSTDTITNSDIEEKATHQYITSGERKITITGTFESIAPYDESYEGRQGYDKLVRVEQWGTTGLKTIDLSNLDNLTQIVQPTESSFKDLSFVYFANSGIQSIPDKMFLNCTKIASFSSCFKYCNNLTTIGNHAFAGCSSVKSFGYAFDNCNKLQTIGNNIFENCKNVTDFSGTFRDTAIKNIPENLFSTCTKVEDFGGTFEGCENLTGNAPELWLRVPNGEENGYRGIPKGNGCFRGCENLTNYEQIPTYWREGRAE